MRALVTDRRHILWMVLFAAAALLVTIAGCATVTTSAARTARNVSVLAPLAAISATLPATYTATDISAFHDWAATTSGLTDMAVSAATRIGDRHLISVTTMLLQQVQALGRCATLPAAKAQRARVAAALIAAEKAAGAWTAAAAQSS